MSRPSVSVVVPFGGDVAEGAELLDGLRALRLGAGDEVVVADNSLEDALAGRHAPGLHVVRAEGERSSYHARNVGAAAARPGTAWLLFVDSDCRPDPDLLDRYFSEPIADDVGAVAGRVDAADEGAGTVAQRFAASRRALDQGETLARGPEAFAATANVLVRRDAFVDLTGFCEGIRSGGDADLSWRLRAAGWRIVYRPAAVVEHRHRTTFAELAHQRTTYGRSGAWLARRHGRPRRQLPLLRLVARAVIGTVVFVLSGQLRRGAFKAFDAVLEVAMLGGTLRANRAATWPGPADATPRPAVVTAVFPDTDDALPDAHVYAARRPLLRPRAAEARATPHWYAEDDGIAQRVVDVVALARERPGAVARAALIDAAGTVRSASLVRRIRAGRHPDVTVGPEADAARVVALLVARAGRGG